MRALDVASSGWFFVLISALFFLTSETACAKDESDVNNHYLPYVQIEGARFFNVIKASERFGADFFAPLWQSPYDIVFTDVRMLDGSGKHFVGSIHMGYRHLASEDKYLYGIYGAFDRKKTVFGNYFNQITFGVECWVNRLFVGVNAYEPIGEKTKSISYGQNEDIVPGVDAEVGYEFVDGLIGYVGGYHFIGNNTDDNYGPKARFTYDWSLNNGNRILNIFDKCGFEVGIRRDKQRDVIWYLSANVRIGLLLSEKQALSGVSRHMIDLVRRDIDVISMTSDVKKVGNAEEEEESPFL